MELKDRGILIVGGSGGIGAEVAKACAREGASVAIGYSGGEQAARETAAAIAASGGKAAVIKFDVASEASVDAGIALAKSVLGNIDGLVNGAGIHVAGPLISLKDEDMLMQIEFNLTGAIRRAKAATVLMVAQRRGSIVNIGSVSGYRMLRGHSVYTATKAGMDGFTRALAAEVAKRSIRVNGVVPGPVMTPMLKKTVQETGDDPATRVPMGRLVEASEVANAIVFLLSDRASAITGAILPVDCGYLLW